MCTVIFQVQSCSLVSFKMESGMCDRFTLLFYALHASHISIAQYYITKTTWMSLQFLQFAVDRFDVFRCAIFQKHDCIHIENIVQSTS